MNTKSLTCIFLLLGLGFAPLYSQGLIIQKNVIVAEDEVQDNVISFGGSIHVKGKVRENVIAFGGSILVEGEVGEAVVGFGSHITLKSTARIDGDVVSLGGVLQKDPGVFLRGDTVSFSFDTPEDMKKFIREGLFGAFIPLLLVIKLISLFIWFILALALAALFPRQITFASDQIRRSFGSIFGIGLLSIIIFTGLVIFATLLSFILIGIPVLITLILLALVIKIFSRVVLFYFFGESLTKAFGSKKPSILAAIVIGFLVLSFIGFIPILGGLVGLFLSIIGWGAVIRTKFGTTENWFRKTKM